jgi:hypothetical protein
VAREAEVIMGLFTEANDARSDLIDEIDCRCAERCLWMLSAQPLFIPVAKAARIGPDMDPQMADHERNFGKMLSFSAILVPLFNHLAWRRD